MELILEKEKYLSLTQRPKISKNINFGAVSDIYVSKKYNEILIAYKLIRSTMIYKMHLIWVFTLYLPIICQNA